MCFDADQLTYAELLSEIDYPHLGIRELPFVKDPVNKRSELVEWLETNIWEFNQFLSRLDVLLVENPLALAGTFLEVLRRVAIAIDAISERQDHKEELVTSTVKANQLFERVASCHDDPLKTEEFAKTIDDLTEFTLNDIKRAIKIISFYIQ
jgi:hypothetical protein